MPWRELKPMDLKVMFIADYLSGRLNFSQLCAAHSISRKTGYKWVTLSTSNLNDLIFETV